MPPAVIQTTHYVMAHPNGAIPPLQFVQQHVVLPYPYSVGQPGPYQSFLQPQFYPHNMIVNGLNGARVPQPQPQLPGFITPRLPSAITPSSQYLPLDYYSTTPPPPLESPQPGYYSTTPPPPLIIAQQEEIISPSAAFVKQTSQQFLPKNLTNTVNGSPNSSSRPLVTTVPSSSAVVVETSKILVDPLKKEYIETSKIWEPVKKEYKRRTLNKDVEYDLVICYIKDPEEFYVRVQESEREFVDLMLKMNDYYSNTKKQRSELKNLNVGSPCVVLHRTDEDSVWYRCVIKQIKENDDVLIRYVDYGNDEIVSKKDLADIEEQFLNVELFAVHSCLYDLPPRFYWSEDDVQIFQQLVLNKQFKGVLIEVDDVCCWKLFEDSSKKRSLAELVLENV